MIQSGCADRCTRFRDNWKSECLQFCTTIHDYMVLHILLTRFSQLEQLLNTRPQSSLRSQTYFWLSLLSARYFSGGEKRQPEIRLRAQAIHKGAFTFATLAAVPKWTKVDFARFTSDRVNWVEWLVPQCLSRLKVKLSWVDWLVPQCCGACLMD